MQNSPEASAPGRNRATGLALAAVVVLAAVLRVGGLTVESLWWDEVLTTYSARAPFPRVIESVRRHENAPPLYFILVNVWAKAFGTSDLTMRLPSALMGIATVALLWRVGTELFDLTVGLTAAALLAVAPIHIAYSQEARMYALLVLLLLLNLWAVVRVIRTRSTPWQIVYVLTAALALLTHTFAAFTLLAVNLFWILRFVRRGQTGVTLRRWALLNTSAILLFGPWVPATLEVARAGLPWLARPTTPWEAFVGYSGVVLAGPVIGLSAVAIGAGVRRRDDRVLLLVLLAIVPVLAPLTYGPFTTRYGLPALLGLTMLAAYGAHALGRWMCVLLVVAAAAGWAMTSTLGHARYLNYTPKADVRAAVEAVRGRAAAGDAVVAGSRGVWHVMEHYARGTGLRICLDFEEAARQQPERVWLIAPAGPADPVTGFDQRSHLPLDGVVVRELLPRREPATTRSVPSAYPRN